MPEAIIQAVSIQRALYEGVGYERELHKAIRMYMGPSLYGVKTSVRQTARMRKRLIRLMAQEFTPKAIRTGARSAQPILKVLGKGGTLTLGPAQQKRLLAMTNAELRVFVARLDRELQWMRGSTRIVMVEGRSNGIPRRTLVRELVKADRSSMDSIRQGFKAKEDAVRALQDAEERLARRPKSQRIRDEVKAARTDLTKAKRSLVNRATLLSRFDTAMRGFVRDSIRRTGYDSMEMQNQDAGFGPKSPRVWISINGSDSCPTCISRHGDVRTFAEWRGSRPGDGDTLCGTSCMCQLLPAEYLKNNPALANPIRVSGTVEAGGVVSLSKGTSEQVGSSTVRPGLATINLGGENAALAKRAKRRSRQR